MVNLAVCLVPHILLTVIHILKDNWNNGSWQKQMFLFVKVEFAQNEDNRIIVNNGGWFCTIFLEKLNW